MFNDLPVEIRRFDQKCLLFFSMINTQVPLRAMRERYQAYTQHNRCPYEDGSPNFVEGIPGDPRQTKTGRDCGMFLVMVKHIQPL